MSFGLKNQLLVASYQLEILKNPDDRWLLKTGIKKVFKCNILSRFVLGTMRKEWL
ncbi:hypothetical protein M1N70_03090 [Peptococcaceae bacterium]|nr:hypothetical protein [Peptococcaceae bacterium]